MLADQREEGSPALGTPLEDLATPVWVLDRKGAIVGANRAARVVEREAGRALPLQTPGSRHILGDASELRRALAEGRSLEVCARGHDNRRYRLLMEPLANPHGEPTGSLLLALESTPARRARSVFARILATAARELEGPLSSLASFAHLARLSDTQGDGSRSRVYLDQLERHTQQLDYLVSELRDLQEALVGEMPLQIESLDLAELVRQAVDAAARVSRDSVFEIDSPRSLMVVADGQRLRRVADALLSNAVRFGAPGGRVRVELLHRGPLAILAVTDTGAGLTEESLAEHLDGPCWYESAPEGGLGLGLYLSREVVERHGGRMMAERLPDGGFRVSVSLPRLPQAPGAGSA